MEKKQQRFLMKDPFSRQPIMMVLQQQIHRMNAMITALGNGWKTPKAAPDQIVTPAVQEAMYDAIFGVMQGTYSPKDALKNMDSAAAN